MADPSDSDLSSDSGSLFSSDPSDGVVSYPANVHQASSKPLIDFVKNEWHTNPKYAYDNNDDRRQPYPWNEYDDLPEWLELVVLMLSTPKVRRNGPVLLLFLIVLFCLWKMYVTPQLTDHAQLTQALDPHFREAVGGWFGSNAIPEFDDLVKVASLDTSVVPAGMEGSKPKRLIIVGDVHGCKAECMFLYHSNICIFSDNTCKWTNFSKKWPSTATVTTI